MRDRGLTVARGVLRVGNGINWLFGIATLAALLVSFPLGDRLAAHLVAKYPHGDIAGTIAVVRVIGLLAIVAAVAAHQIFTRLLAIVATVDAGDPFIIDNAARLACISKTNWPRSRSAATWAARCWCPRVRRSKN